MRRLAERAHRREGVDRPRLWPLSGDDRPPHYRKDSVVQGRGGRVQPCREGVRPYPLDADNYRVLARGQFIAFKANLCDTVILQEAVARRLTEKQLRESSVLRLPRRDCERASAGAAALSADVEDDESPLRTEVPDGFSPPKDEAMCGRPEGRARAQFFQRLGRRGPWGTSRPRRRSRRGGAR